MSRKGNEFDRFYYMAIGEVFTDLRQKSGRKYSDIAKLFEIETNTFYSYEKGRRKMPFDLYMKLCNLYCVKPEDIFEQVNAIATLKMKEEIKNEK